VIELRRALKHHPPLKRSGDVAFVLPQSWLAKNDERLLSMRLACNRWLFGQSMQHLVPDYFDTM